MWSLIHAPPFRSRRNDGTDRLSRDGRLRGPLLEMGGLLGGGWLTATHSGTAAAYRLDNQFADGAVLVKEVLAGAHGRMSTGQANWASDATKVWFVMIKDRKGRYPDNPLWGDGWGWALFKSDAPNKQVATDYRKDCRPCHQPARATDWVYVKSYPVLTHE
jgi:Cytochrome P460